MVQEAQDVSERLVAESRERSDAIVAEARARATELTDVARREADEMRQALQGERDRALAEARVEAVEDLAELKAHAERLLADIEVSARALASVLAGSGSTVDLLARPTNDASVEMTQPLPMIRSVGVPKDRQTHSREHDGAREARSQIDADDDVARAPEDDPKTERPAPDAGAARLSDLSVEGQLRFERTSGSGFSGSAAGQDDNLEEALAAARPLGWLFRGN